jgi:signal peptidase II
VTDFISVGTFPVFNVADASISVGAAVLFLGIILMEQAERRKKKEMAEQQDTPPGEKPSEATSE